MALSTLLPPDALDDDASPGLEPKRTVNRLPSNRSLLGGFLIAVAVVGVYAAWVAAAAPSGQLVAVATRVLGPGDHIDSSDVRLERMDLGDGLQDRFFISSDDLIGSVALGPIGPDEPISRTAVLTSGVDQPEPVPHELSIPVERQRALGDAAGRLKPGERVDILATTRAASEDTTELIAAGVVVVAVESGSSGFGASDTLTLTLGVSDLETAARIVHAVDIGSVTVVRSTASEPSSTSTPVTDEDEDDPSPTSESTSRPKATTTTTDPPKATTTTTDPPKTATTTAAPTTTKAPPPTASPKPDAD